MDIDYIYNGCRELLVQYKGTWVYDDYFGDDLGRKYFEDTVKSDPHIQILAKRKGSEDDVIDYIVGELESNGFIHDVEQIDDWLNETA